GSLSLVPVSPRRNVASFSAHGRSQSRIRYVQPPRMSSRDRTRHHSSDHAALAYPQAHETNGTRTAPHPYSAPPPPPTLDRGTPMKPNNSQPPHSPTEPQAITLLRELFGRFDPDTISRLVPTIYAPNAYFNDV